MNLSRSRREARSHEFVEVRGGLRRIGATCTATQTYTRCKDMPIPEYDQNGGGIRRRLRVLVGMASLASQRPASDRLLGLPPADRQSCGCSPAIEGISIQYPPKHARVSDRMSGKRRSSTLETKLGELVADSFRTNGKRAQTVLMVNAAAARRFPAASRAGRAAPATCGKRVPPADEGVLERGHACAQSRRTYS